MNDIDAMKRIPAVVLTTTGLLGGLALASATAAGAHRLLREAAAPGGPPDAAVAGLAALAVALIATWAALALSLALVAHLPGAVGAAARRAHERVTPAVVRRWAAVALGASLTASVLPGTAVAASLRGPGWSAASTGTPTPGSMGKATSSPTSGSSGAPEPGWSSLPSPAAPSPTATATTAPSPTATATTAPHGPGWTPRRPPARQRIAPDLLVGRDRTAASAEVVVRRGDSLWSIVRAQLGPGATDAEIADAWPRWHAANARRVGPDPHLLLPGTRLVPPTDRHEPGTSPTTKGTP